MNIILIITCSKFIWPMLFIRIDNYKKQLTFNLFGGHMIYFINKFHKTFGVFPNSGWQEHNKKGNFGQKLSIFINISNISSFTMLFKDIKFTSCSFTNNFGEFNIPQVILKKKR